ncbi:hypothetical protein LTR84_009906 [Exophiala bonariae]|uniref:OTU domain-containing protein n=1 Tax=Exophiala bonariae TaxID=1690606 RepID=A0AAV9NJL7_9EURO|nr:hypothetical protein LTR84_009906 [Exophiala bonariae]
MVRKPKAVWPGLERRGMYHKQIAGDGNCLFASLSDQLYGDPTRHPEIRARVIDHMRNLRPLFEDYVNKNDVQQRRKLRSATAASRQEPEDAFEHYLTLMSQNGTYGGEPELVAFCQVFDQDVTVHLPRLRNFDQDHLFYTNEHRQAPSPAPPLDICYGGDEVTRAHYDSARPREDSTPRSRNKPTVISSDLSGNIQAVSPNPRPFPNVSDRQIRNDRSDLPPTLVNPEYQNAENLIVRWTEPFIPFHRRVRTPSVTSSQRSSSSKRSLEEDSEPIRASKRTDAGISKRMRKRDHILKKPIYVVVNDSDDEDDGLSPRMATESPNADTPSSTQDTDPCSDTPSTEYETTIIQEPPCSVDIRQ